jgi:uncharacterized membrane protein YphA (DoxX/SURF4 family)
VKLPSSSTYAFWLALFRIYAGVFWLIHGIPKFTQSQNFMPPNGFIGQFVNQGIQVTSGPYHGFLSNVVLPNIAIFAELVRVGEVVTGCLLLLGFYTRLGGLIGMILTFNYFSGKGGLAHVSALSELDALTFVVCAVNLVLPTGRVLGVDGLLAHFRRKPQPAPSAVFVDEPPMTGPSAPRS